MIGIVALTDGIEQQQSHAGNDEDLLDDDGAADQDRRLQADQRDYRDQRVAQRVPDDDEPFAKAPWPKRCGYSPGAALPASWCGSGAW